MLELTHYLSCNILNKYFILFDRFYSLPYVIEVEVVNQHVKLKKCKLTEKLFREREANPDLRVVSQILYQLSRTPGRLLTEKKNRFDSRSMLSMWNQTIIWEKQTDNHICELFIYCTGNLDLGDRAPALSFGYP